MLGPPPGTHRFTIFHYFSACSLVLLMSLHTFFEASATILNEFGLQRCIVFCIGNQCLSFVLQPIPGPSSNIDHDTPESNDQ